MPVNRARLSLESLEDRAVPAQAAWTPELFDTTAPGQMPADWKAWGSDGQSGYAVSADGRLLSTGSSTRQARTWTDGQRPADVAVTAAVRVEALAPAQVFARGRALDSDRPTFYAAQITRGVNVQIVRVEAGQMTVLATLTTPHYVSGIWIDLTLITQGSAVHLRAQRRDTGAWLAADGSWQPMPVTALAVHDSAIQGSGRVGVARPAAYAGSVTLDEFRAHVAAGDVAPPVVAASVRSLGRTVQANTVSAWARLGTRITDVGAIERVEFLIDDTLVAESSGRRSISDVDTRNLANGAHVLTVRAWDAAGNRGEKRVPFRVFNRPADMPTAARHYDHIRYAALAYNGLAIGATEHELLRSSIDLVVPHARYLQQIDAAAPDTPQVIYSNVSNLYQELLADWLTFADRRRVSREAAFYHVAGPTPFTGNSPSSQPVYWFWNVRGSQDYTAKARSGTAGDVPFPTAGGTLAIGYPERFGEIGMFLTRAAQAGWHGVVEYAAQVDRHGAPLAWKTLAVTSDSTNGFTQSGRLFFAPPADWQPSILPGDDSRLYYVRLRAMAGAANDAPLAARIVGRDYVGANGGSVGVIRAFDKSADKNRDGYLSDEEYGQRRANFDARFAYESRWFYPHYGQMRFATNPADNVVKAWAADYHRRLLAATPLADGLFIDNSGGSAPTTGVSVSEPAGAYAWNHAALLGSISRAVGPKWVMANTSGGKAEAIAHVARIVPATIEEFALRPLAHHWSQFLDMARQVQGRLAASNGQLILDTLSQGGAPTDERTRLAALAYYYLLADPERTMLMTWGGEEPASSWSRHWFDAIAFDIGQPKGEWSEFARGLDPANSNLTYRVLQRSYENALVLYKPLSYTAGKGAGETGDATATVHALNGNYRRLNADGTQGPVITSLALRNGEGAVLVRVG